MTIAEFDEVLMAMANDVAAEEVSVEEMDAMYEGLSADDKASIDKLWTEFLGKIITCATKYGPHFRDVGHVCNGPVISARSRFAPPSTPTPKTDGGGR
jgi:hypothetical protein